MDVKLLPVFFTLKSCCPSLVRTVGQVLGNRPCRPRSDSHFLSAHRTVWILVAAASIAWTCGCNRGDSDANEMPPVDPSGAATSAMELYDKDGSGSLDESELAACPGLLAARARYDTDGNGQISRDEITARMKAMYDRGTSWITVNCQIIQGGRPLAGAKVRFVPEPFLKEALPEAEGTTDGQGQLTPAVADDKLPETLKGTHSVRPGVYRVEVEHANVKQPHKPLGCEVDQLAHGGTDVEFKL